jgi:hypothetical protein
VAEDKKPELRDEDSPVASKNGSKKGPVKLPNTLTENPWKILASLAIVALAVIPLVVLIERVPAISVVWPEIIQPTIPGVPTFYQPTPIPTAAATDSAPFFATSELCNSDYITITLVLNKPDVSNGLLNINVWACVGYPAPSHLDMQGGTVPATFSMASQQLSTKLTKTDSPQRLGSIAVPIDGDPRTYPLDTYTVPTSSGSLHISASFLDGSVPLIPLQKIEVDPGAAAAFNWSNNSPTVGGLDDFITAQRTGTTLLFVVCMLAVPLVLIALISHRLLSSPRSIEGIVGVAAIMLAMLPIRTVLVSGDISTLTLVDFALAFEIALLAAGAALIYLWAGLRSGTPQSAGSGDPKDMTEA